jgi:hypothetical protein
MKTHAMVLFAITFLLGTCVAAKAETPDAIIVTVPFDFVVSGKALPADTYTVSTPSDNKFGPLLLTGRENGNSVFLRPFERKSVSINKPHLSFEQVGGQHLLRTIQTTEGIYNLRLPRSAVLAAAASSHSGGTASGGSGDN